MLTERTAITEFDYALLRLLAKGNTQEEMGRELRKSKWYINRQLNRLYDYLGAPNGASAVAISIARGLIRNPYEETPKRTLVANETTSSPCWRREIGGR